MTVPATVAARLEVKASFIRPVIIVGGSISSLKPAVTTAPRATPVEVVAGNSRNLVGAQHQLRQKEFKKIRNMVVAELR